MLAFRDAREHAHAFVVMAIVLVSIVSDPILTGISWWSRHLSDTTIRGVRNAGYHIRDWVTVRARRFRDGAR